MVLPLPKVVSDVGPGGGIVTAMRGMNALTADNLKNQYYGPNMQSQIDSRNALTQGQNIENQYMPDKLRLANAMAQLQNQYYAPTQQADIDYKNALTSKVPFETNELKIKNQFLPQMQQADIAEKEAQAKYYNMGGSGLGTGGKEQLFYQNAVSQDNPQLGNDASKIYEAANVLAQGGDTLSDGTKLNPLSASARASLDRVTKYGTTAQGINQTRSDAILNNLLNKGDELMPNASEFAGLAGKANKPASAFGASLGQNDPRYRDFQIFTRQIVPQLANQMILTEGARANNTQKAMMIKVANPLYWDSNPQLAMEEWKYLTDTFRNSISPTLGRSISELQQSARESSNTQKESNNSKKPTLRYNQQTGDFEEIK